MRSILKYIGDYFAEQNKIGYWIFVVGMLALGLAFNYSVDFENSILDSYYGTYKHYLFSFLLYFFVWSVMVLAYIFWYKRPDLLTNKSFWALGIFAFAVLGTSAGAHWHLYFIENFVPPQMQFLVRKCTINLLRAAIYFLPIALYWWFAARKTQPLYGFNSPIFNAKPYWLMLAIMLPLIIAASFLPDFQAAYPRYRDVGAAEYLGYNIWTIQCFFESCYGINFVFLEFFFRGFLVLAFARYMGQGAIVPMITVYCVLHFGKPLGEAIGSIFGGLILGIVAYRTQSIWGGIIVHLGVAYLMEFAAFLQQQY